MFYILKEEKKWLTSLARVWDADCAMEFESFFFIINVTK